MQHLTEALVLMSDMSLPDDFQMCVSVREHAASCNRCYRATLQGLFFSPPLPPRLPPFHPSPPLSLSALAGLRQCQDVA